jgi:hypothetical protein
MIDETEEALQHVIGHFGTMIDKLVPDPEHVATMKLAILAVAAGSYKIGYEQGRLRGRAE